MKIQIQYKIFLYLLLIPQISAGSTSINSTKTSKEKNIKKSFNVSSNATLKVDNSFGNVNIITWDENRVEFDITIKVSGNDDDKVEERLEGIDIEFSSSSNLVSAITKIEILLKYMSQKQMRRVVRLQLNIYLKHLLLMKRQLA